MFYSEDQWLQWMDELAENDFVVVDDFITDELFQIIMRFFGEVEAAEKLNKAGIGAQKDYTVKSEIRGDFIYWLDENRDQALSPFFNLMEELNQSLRRFCFLSLPGSEFHERTNRQITVLIYLNKNWKHGDGGELVIYKNNKEIKVEPIAKRLLLFKSDVIEHEVLTTNVPRYSLTGWLLRKPPEIGYLFR